MLLVTGDTHGAFIRIISLIRDFELTSQDCIIILGDAGFNFYGNQYGDAHKKRRVNSYGVPIFCIHGNHEMRPATIKTYRREVWHGGTVWVEPEYPNLLFAEDGQLYQFGNRTAFVIGGAYSVDKFYRLARNPSDPKWWPDEQPNAATKALVETNLEKLGWNADIVLSHTCPFSYIPTEAFLPGIDQSSVDNSTEQWLGGLEKQLSYNTWYCGHWHIDKRIDRMHFLFNGTEEIREMEES